MKLLKITAAAACVFFLLTAAYAASAGSSGDPLVTLSYLNGTFTNQVRTMVDQTVNDRRAEMEQSLKDLLAGQGGASTPGTSSGAFTLVTLGQGQSLVGSVGCEVMLRLGSAVCGASDAVGLIDTTGGTVLASGEALASNHLYMVTISPRTVTAATAATLLVRGPYTIQ